MIWRRNSFKNRENAKVRKHETRQRTKELAISYFRVFVLSRFRDKKLKHAAIAIAAALRGALAMKKQ
jgi:hypothetical protein